MGLPRRHEWFFVGKIATKALRLYETRRFIADGFATKTRMVFCGKDCHEGTKALRNTKKKLEKGND